MFLSHEVHFDNILLHHNYLFFSVSGKNLFLKQFCFSLSYVPSLGLLQFGWPLGIAFGVILSVKVKGQDISTKIMEIVECNADTRLRSCSSFRIKCGKKKARKLQKSKSWLDSHIGHLSLEQELYLCISCVERIFSVRTATFLENNMVTPDSTLSLSASFTTAQFTQRTS